MQCGGSRQTLSRLFAFSLSSHYLPVLNDEDFSELLCKTSDRSLLPRRGMARRQLRQRPSRRVATCVYMFSPTIALQSSSFIPSSTNLCSIICVMTTGIAVVGPMLLRAPRTSAGRLAFRVDAAGNNIDGDRREAPASESICGFYRWGTHLLQCGVCQIGHHPQFADEFTVKNTAAAYAPCAAGRLTRRARISNLRSDRV